MRTSEVFQIARARRRNAIDPSNQIIRPIRSETIDLRVRPLRFALRVRLEEFQRLGDAAAVGSLVVPEIDADRPLFKDLVEGTAAHKDELEQTVSSALAKDWTWGRIDRLVRAILLAGAYELVHRRDVPPKVAINEYVEIAHAFYDKGEPTFVNSVLDRVARQERSAELGR